MSQRAMLLDNSTLSAVATCATKAMLRYHYHRVTREEIAVLKAGSAVHEALAAFLDPGWREQSEEMVRATALAVLDRAYQAWAEANVESGDRFAWANVRACVETWLRLHTRASLPFVIEQVEVGFVAELDLPHEESGLAIELCGRLDGIVRSKMDNTRWVLEHKTTGSLTPWWAEQWHWASQLTQYVWGAQRVYGSLIVGVYVNAVELPKLPSDPTRRCKDHKVPYAECGKQHTRALLTPHQRGPEVIRAWQQSVVDLAARFAALQEAYPGIEHLRAVPQEGQFTGACRFCEFKNLCAVGRQERDVRLLLVESVWNPLEGTLILREGETA